MKNIIIVPSWIQKVLVREKMNIKDILSYSKLCELIAPQDLRAFLYLQSYGALTEYHITDTDSKALLSAWKKGLSPEKASELDSMVNSSAGNPVDKDHLKSLISGISAGENIEKGFELIPADHFNLFLVLNDGYFGDQYFEVQDINIVENILRVLYGEFVQEEIARTPIFKRYVKMLGKQFA